MFRGKKYKSPVAEDLAVAAFQLGQAQRKLNKAAKMREALDETAICAADRQIAAAVLASIGAVEARIRKYLEA